VRCLAAGSKISAEPMQLLPDDPAEYLCRLGKAGEGPHDIAGAALMLAALDHAGRDLKPYIAHLAEIAEHAKSEARLAVNAEGGAQALAMLFTSRFGYDGDRLSYDDPQNADLIAVIDRRRGMPVALGILWLHAARAAGFGAAGLNSPGHFLLQVGFRGSEALIDPFNGGAAVDHDSFLSHPSLREAGQELKDYIRPVSDLEILLRLQNNLKLRAIEKGELPRALDLAKRMVLIGPNRPDLWLDLAQLHEQEGELGAARGAYNSCISLAEPGQPLHNEAALALEGLRRRLN
jgi:regulator of sirC expression with transglutaminase-like and TPR domain